MQNNKKPTIYTLTCVFVLSLLLIGFGREKPQSNKFKPDEQFAQVAKKAGPAAKRQKSSMETACLEPVGELIEQFKNDENTSTKAILTARKKTVQMLSICKMEAAKELDFVVSEFIAAPIDSECRTTEVEYRDALVWYDNAAENINNLPLTTAEERSAAHFAITMKHMGVISHASQARLIRSFICPLESLALPQ